MLASMNVVILQWRFQREMRKLLTIAATLAVAFTLSMPVFAGQDTNSGTNSTTTSHHGKHHKKHGAHKGKKKNKNGTSGQ